MSEETQPYPGPRSFDVSEDSIFFGREREVANLASMVAAHSLVVFYAASGAGKSSLLNAGLVAALRSRGMRVIPGGRVQRIDHREWSDPSTNRYMRNAILNWADSLGLPELREANDLTSLIGNLAGDDDPLVLILDQMEELFTLYPESWRDREPFFAELQSALDKHRSLRIVLALREDHIAKLDAFASLFDDSLQDRFRMDRLTESAARKAIVEPVTQTTDRRFAKGVPGELLEELLSMTVESPEGTRTVLGEFVEPLQLQIVCRTMWDELSDKQTKITAAHVQRFAQVKEVLARYVGAGVEEIVAATDCDEGELREWMERVLITPAGTRGLVFGTDTDAPEDALSILEERRIVRAVQRSGAGWYELTHDLFVEAIRRDNRSWFTRQFETQLVSTDLTEAIEAQFKLARRQALSSDPEDRVQASATLLEVLSWPVLPGTIREDCMSYLDTLAEDRVEKVKQAARRARNLAQSGTRLTVADAWAGERRRTRESLLGTWSFAVSAAVLLAFSVASAYLTAWVGRGVNNWVGDVWLGDRPELAGILWVPVVVGLVWWIMYLYVFVDRYATAGGSSQTPPKYHFGFLLTPFVPSWEGWGSEKLSMWPIHFFLPLAVAAVAATALNEWFNWPFSLVFYIAAVPSISTAIVWFDEATLLWEPPLQETASADKD